MVKEEPIDGEILEVKSEEKFSATKELADKTSIQTISIAFLNEKTKNSINSQLNKLQNSK